MNERFKQLMDQAGIDVEAVENLGEMPAGMKFAELIVRECVHAVENRGGMCGALASNWIKEHFGVEE